MESLVKYIVENLVEDKEAIEITTKTEEGITIIHIQVAENDIGKVIGKNGKIAQSIRTIVRSVAAKTGVKYAVKIN